MFRLALVAALILSVFTCDVQLPDVTAFDDGLISITLPCKAGQRIVCVEFTVNEPDLDKAYVQKCLYDVQKNAEVKYAVTYQEHRAEIGDTVYYRMYQRKGKSSCKTNVQSFKITELLPASREGKNN